MERDCPVCRVPLNPVTIRQTQIDVCLTCHGIWFDKDELSQVHQHGGLPDKFLTTAAVAGKRDSIVCEFCDMLNDRAARQCSHCGKPLSFPCPACQHQLEEAPVGSVMVDRCMNCQGVWFDGGELAILFDEFKQQKKAEVERVRREGGDLGGDLAAWAAIDALDLLIWQPGLMFHAGHALGHASHVLGDVATNVPGAVAHGIGAAGEFIGDVPEMAGNVAEGAIDLAGGAAAAAGDVIGNVPEIAGSAAEFAGDVIGNVPEMAGNMAELAGDVIENVPEMAGALAEAGSSFIEMLFEIIGSLFE